MHPIVINLALAIFWLFLAVSIFILEWMRGPLAVRFLDMSLGWVALLLFVFNMVRVTSIWMYQKQRRQMLAESELLRQQFSRREPRHRNEPPDPNFQFTDPTPGPDNKPT